MYPVCVCSIERNKEGAFLLRKPGETERLEVSCALARLLFHLDGKTDPLELATGFSEGETDRLLSLLEEMGYIMTRRWNGSLLSAQTTLWFAPRRVPKTVRRVCKTMSMLLAVVWLPVLIIGLMQFLRGNWVDGGSNTLGLVLGTLTGLFLHEAGHSFTCVGLGGRLVRAGILSSFFVLRGAFVELDDVMLPRFSRVHTILSGVEMNFLLAGLAFAAGTVVWGDCFAAFGITNIMLGLLNLGVYYIGFDGAKTLHELAGTDPALSVDILTEYTVRRTIRRHAGITGRARIAVTQILAVSQLGVLILLALNLKEVLSWVF